jgi:AAA15 family ATPase/GTPase
LAVADSLLATADSLSATAKNVLATADRLSATAKNVLATADKLLAMANKPSATADKLLASPNNLCATRPACRERAIIRPAGHGAGVYIWATPPAPMENAIKFLRIQNFKSIKDVTLHPRRVNLIIGEPNVGKSNLLEAMTLLGSITYEPTERFLGSFIRYEEPRQLFYDNLVGNTIKVETDELVAGLVFDKRNEQFHYLFGRAEYYKDILDDTFPRAKSRSIQVEMGIVASSLVQAQNSKGSSAKAMRLLFTQISFRVDGKTEVDEMAIDRYRQYGVSSKHISKPYIFKKSVAINWETGSLYLTPPHGSNLIEVIQTHAPLRKEVAKMFERYGQKLNLRIDERKLEVIKDQDGMTYSYPYSSVADTLQRIIFYLAAIESNDDAVLLFEEPEAHLFPVYVARLGRRIAESRNNQFFIDTHSPYLVTEILERMLPDEAAAGELAIFAAYYHDHQTKLHQLSDDEVRSIREDGIDVFYNMKRFTTGAADA